MTFAIYIILFIGLFLGVLNILPVAGVLNPAFASSVIVIIGYMKAWNFLLPISDLFICVGIVISFELVVWAWHALKWILHLFGLGSKSSS